MTGFARVRKTLPEGELVVSLKSVNHRGLDLHFHMTTDLDPFENALRKLIKENVARGHVQLQVSMNRSNGATGESFLNRPLLEAYLKAFAEAAQQSGIAASPGSQRGVPHPGDVSRRGGNGIGRRLRKLVPGGCARRGAGSAQSLP